MKGGPKLYKRKDYTGQTFGYLTALKPTQSTGAKMRWLFSCSCGNTVEKVAAQIARHWKNGYAQSCGCQKYSTMRKPKTHGMYKHPAYWVWRSMRDRCRLPTHQAWQNYGARGITVDKTWEASFEAFWNDMKDSYKPGLHLDRIDNNSGYNKNNCHWVTARQNTKNKRNSLPVDLETLAKTTQIPLSTLYYRWKHGLSMTSRTADPDRASWFSGQTAPS